MLYIGLLVPYLGLHGNADLEERPLQFSVQHVDVLLHPLKIGNMREKKKTLPKALRTQALTALTSYFGLEGLVQYA